MWWILVLATLPDLDFSSRCLSCILGHCFAFDSVVCHFDSVGSSTILLIIFPSGCSLDTNMVDSNSILCDAFVCILFKHGLVLLIYSLIKMWCEFLKKLITTITLCLHILGGFKLVKNYTYS